MKTAILILAAGSSRRMGQPKQLLKVRNTTLLGLAIEQAKYSNADELFAVIGAHREKLKPWLNKKDVKTIVNLDYTKGLGSSISAGIKHLISLDIDAVVIMLADQPEISHVFINALMISFKQNPQHISASLYNSILGVPAIFPNSYFEKLIALDGDIGAKALLNSNAAEVIGLPNKNTLDIDTPEDYRDFIKNA